MLGPPASGKGTFAGLISRDYHIPATSTGAILRRESELGTPLGLAVHELTSKGRLAPDDVVIPLALQWVDRQSDGFLFDGFPRTLPQGEALQRHLADTGRGLQAAILLDLPLEEIRRRVLARRVCSQCRRNFSAGTHIPENASECPECGGALFRRADDTLEALDERMRLYERITLPLVPFYRAQGLLATVDACGAMDLAMGRIKKALQNGSESAGL